MKLAFISDIHGNAIALESVLEDIKEKNVDRVLVLGDLCYRGPEPERSLQLVRKLEADVLKGNADEWVVRGIQKGEVPDQVLDIMNQEREWTLSKLDQESVDYLESLPTELNLEFNDVKIHAFHATPTSLFDIVQASESDERLEKMLVQKEANIYIYAHIHKPFIRYFNGKCFMNTGSVGLPFDGQSTASYGFVEINENSFHTSIVRVKYDTSKFYRKIDESDYPNKEFFYK